MLFDLAKSFRPLTMSPVVHVVNQAHKMARRRLEAGGTAAASGGAEDDPAAADIVIPPDVDPAEVAAMLRTKLGIRPSANDAPDALHRLERKLGGRVVVRGWHVLRLGDGNFAKGRAFMQSVIAKVRGARRTCTT